MKFTVLAFILFFFSGLTFGQVSLKEITLKPGKFNVGFRHYLATDSARTYQRKMDWNNKYMPRPIPVSIWYPSNEKPDVKKISVLDYMEILKREEEWEYLPNEQILNWFYYPNTPANQNHLNEQTTAFFDIPSANGKFPLIIYAPSYQASSIENFALFEYLSSHGYIVISSPSRGNDNRFFEGGTIKDLETQARDIEFLIKEAANFSNADPEQMAAMGFSFGGLSNVLVQMRNENIKAIVSLDGSIKYQYDTLKKSPFFDVKKVDVPFIHMAQKNIPEQILKEDNIKAELNYKFEFYDSLTNSEAYQLKFHNLTHSYFSTLGVLFQPRDERQDKSDSEIMESHKWVSIYVLNFLNAYLKKEESALEFMINLPEKNGVEKGLITSRKKQAKKKRFLFEDFNELAEKQRYENLLQLYDLLLKKYPSLELAEGKLNNLGLQLAFHPQHAQNGIKVLLLATEIYPKSANLFDSLAEAYLYTGNKEKAIENFEKSLELNAQNQNAVYRLKHLRK